MPSAGVNALYRPPHRDENVGTGRGEDVTLAIRPYRKRRLEIAEMIEILK